MTIAAVLAAAAMYAIFPAVGYGLANIDDYAYVWRHAEVAGGLSRSHFLWAWTFLDDAIWMPLTWLSYQFDFTAASVLGLPSTSALHFHSIALHIVNMLLVWRFLHLLFFRAAKDRGECGWRVSVFLPFLCALLWGVHPLRCESVVWISSRKDLVSMFFMLLSLLAWLRGRMAKGAGMRWMVASVVVYVLAGAAKPSVVTLPALMVLLDVFVLRPVDFPAYLPGRGRERPEWRGLVRWALGYVPYGVVALAVAAEGAWVQRYGGGMAQGARIAVLWRLINAAVSYGVYLWNTVCPTGLAVQCTMRYPHLPRFALPGLVIFAGFCWGVWRLLRRGASGRLDEGWRRVLCGCLWFFVAMIPMSGIVSFGFHAFADRFTYIPSIGLALALCGFLSARRMRLGKAVLASMAVVALVLAGLAHRQTRFWRDDRTLFTRTLDVDGEGNAFAQMNLGLYLYAHGHDLAGALEHFRKAHRSEPNVMLLYGNYFVIALCEAGEVKEANGYLTFIKDWNARRESGEIQMLDVDEMPKLISRIWMQAKLACWIEDKDLRKEARKELNELFETGGITIRDGWLEDSHPERERGIIDFICLLGRLELKDGHADLARRIWSQIPRFINRGDNSYVHYRHLWADGGGTD